MGSFPLLIFCAIAMGDAIAQNSSDITLDIVSLISGNWTNRAQIEAGSTEHDLFQSRIVPVFIPVFYPSVVLLVEDVINGKLLRRILCVVVRDETDDNVVYLMLYDFTDARGTIAGELEDSDLYNLTMADLHHATSCVDSYVRLRDDVFSGMCLLCSQMIDGHYPAFGVTATCDVFTLTVPLSIPVRPTTKPYVFRRVGPSYPLINAPQDYVSPCNKSKKLE